MSKDNTQCAFVPRLRFPEFKDAPAWLSATIGNRCKSFSGGTPDTSNRTFYDGDIPFIRSAEIGEKRTELFLTEEGLLNSAAKMVQCGDLLVALYGANSGDVAMAATKGAINQAIMCLRTDESAAFLYHYLTARKAWIIATYLQGGQGNLSGDIIKSVSLPFPACNEQEKIAECLGSLDDLIAAEGRKLAALRDHKKGLMQQLFPREGETRPRLRFPEFQDATEWEERPLDACFSRIRNGFVGTATPFYIDGGIPYLQGKNVKKGRIEPTGLVTISKDFHEKQKKSQLRRSDIVMVQSGHVGECACIDEAYAGANCHALIIMTPRARNHSPFFVQCFGSDYGQRLIAQITTGNTIKHILASAMQGLAVRAPQFAEQQRIADCLSSLDTLIAAQAEKLDALRTHKRGLMQQLFPSPVDN